MDIVTRVIGALMRAILVMALVWLPAFMVPVASPQALQASAVIGFVLGGFVFLEYSAVQPSLMEFRYAPPLNRLKYLALLLILCAAGLMGQDQQQQGWIWDLALRLADLSSAEWSPPHLAMTALAGQADIRAQTFLHGAFAIGQAIGLLTIAFFWGLIHFGGWPPRGHMFNIWINMPTFEPSCGGDLAAHFERQGRINLILGLIWPFLLPALLQVVMPEGVLPYLNGLYGIIWLVGVWCILPISLVMRGMAMKRIAVMIRDQRAVRAGQDLALA